ncbi:sulfite exporter TauE/SafE family protein [Photobacterium satsumensis]|uniref:sulfite exporter TauE/SafE family protein n=1 Tax=Photobacterium satsumensis TaxID=2910239 RepID=UPI003D0AA547
MEELYHGLFIALTFNELLVRLMFGGLIGFCLGLTGVGGGVLIIPILQIAFGMNPVLAVGTASVISSLVKINAAVSHIVAKNVSWKEVFYVLIGAVPVTLVITEVILRMTANPKYSVMINSVVEVLIISIMMFALATMIVKWKRIQSGDVPSAIRGGSKVKGISSGAACGAIIGSTGVGGGVLILPTLNSILGVDIKRSVGSSIVIALVLSGISAIKYSTGGQSDIVTALVLVAGSFVGVPLAVRVVKNITDTGMYLVSIAIISISLVMTLISI